MAPTAVATSSPTVASSTASSSPQITVKNDPRQKPRRCCMAVIAQDDQRWQYGDIITYRILDGAELPVAVDIVDKAASAWNSVQTQLTLTQARKDTATPHVRVQLQGEQPFARVVKNSKDSTANLCLGLGGFTNGDVFGAEDIRWLAMHLFGHALGLGHAVPSVKPNWNEAAVRELCRRIMGGDDGEKAYTQLVKPPGPLRDAASIMTPDVPRFLLLPSGTERLAISGVIDKEASRAVVEGLIAPRTLLNTIQWPTNDKKETNEQEILTDQRTKVFAGFTMVDISMESDLTFLCLPTKVTDVGYTMGLTKGPATQVYSMKANFIGFRPGDRRVQTGRYSFAEGRKKTDPNGKRAFMPSESHTLEVEFKVAYKTTPKVVCAIDHVQRFLKLSVRARAWAENITPTGFRLRLATFDNSAMIQLGVSWLAHDSTDDTIRSGNFNCSDDLRDLRTEISGTATFDRPFPQRPRELFAAFSRFDVPPTKQLRISCETPLWTERDVQYKLRTWKDESAFCGLEGIYVALL